MKKTKKISDLKFFKNSEEVKGLIEDYVYSFLNIKEDTVEIKRFIKKKIDPVKFLFDFFIFYSQNFEKTLNAEIQRQKDKTINNWIGNFHEELIACLPNCSKSKERGFDICFTPSINERILIEVKNKFNTMNSSSMKTVYERMEKAIKEKQATNCYLIEIIAKKSGKKIWKPSINGIKKENVKIQQISIDVFYKEVTKIEDAFFRMYQYLSKKIKKIVEEIENSNSNKTININKNKIYTLDDILKITFASYLGFNKQNF